MTVTSKDPMPNQRLKWIFRISALCAALNIAAFFGSGKYFGLSSSPEVLAHLSSALCSWISGLVMLYSGYRGIPPGSWIGRTLFYILGAVIFCLTSIIAILGFRVAWIYYTGGFNEI